MYRKCGKPNRFAKVCLMPAGKRQDQSKSQGHQYRPNRKSDVRQITHGQQSSSDDEYLYTLDQDPATTKTPMVDVTVNSVPIKMIVDTGALTDILDESAFTKLKQCKNIRLQPPTKRIFTYGCQSQLTMLGKFDASLEFEGRYTTSTIHVLHGNHGSLLSYKTASDLCMIDVKINQIGPSTLACDQITQQYPNLFKGIGKLKNVEVKLHIDQTVPAIAPPSPNQFVVSPST